jgi:hypothetical protein
VVFPASFTAVEFSYYGEVEKVFEDVYEKEILSKIEE